jgi:hypothetical protein
VIVVKSDPAGHAPYIGMPNAIDIRIDIRTGSITIANAGPWVGVLGALAANGGFEGTGRGTVAGYPNVLVVFAGIVYDDGRIAGDYTMGAGHELPSGEPITYGITGQRTGPL